MPFSHHSHSGQFCNHAVDSLAAVVDAAAARRMSVYALTEHCPRSNDHLYPGEKEGGWDYDRQTQLYDDFIAEALRLRKAHCANGTLTLLVGFEAEWIHPVQSPQIAGALLAKHADHIDFVVGSVHFVREIPIDYDRAYYEQARDLCGGEVELFGEYFDAQFEMLKKLQPKVVGHFDLIRLWSDAPDSGWQSLAHVWEKIKRNLEFVQSYGGLLELNSSALRKGLAQPYPREEIVRAFTQLGGRFVMSDDSHGVGHIGTNYARLLDFITQCQLDTIGYLSKEKDGLKVNTITIDQLRQHPFWTS